MCGAVCGWPRKNPFTKQRQRRTIPVRTIRVRRSRRRMQGSIMNSGKRLALAVSVLAQFLLASFLIQTILIRPLISQETTAREASPQDAAKLALREGWSLQSSSKVEAKGEVISTLQFAATGWQDVTVPTTVVAALVKSHALPDPSFGTNLRQFAGVTYPIGGNFSNLAMQTDSPYAVSWWYRKSFTAPASYFGKTVWLNFEGINYRANVWLNGKQIANSNDVAGAWRTYELNVTDAVNAGGDNTLAVQVWAPTEKDLAITFVDWNPAPPDKNMGLWREVYLTTTGPVALRYPTVVSKLDLPINDRAQLTVTTQLKNGTGEAVKGKLKGEIVNVKAGNFQGRNFERDIELAPNESKDVTFTPDKFDQLSIANPELWWPAQMGEPHLYSLTMQFTIEGAISDRAATRFGIRET